MPDNLFGSPTAHLDRFKTPVVTRKKPSRFHPPPVLTVPDEMARRIQKQWAEDRYFGAMEYLRVIEAVPLWERAMTPDQYKKIRSQVAALKPEWLS